MNKPLRLVYTRGLPGSGKTTFAHQWVAEDPLRRARVNRDDLRRMLHNSLYLGRDTEDRVILAAKTLITSLLNSGVSVVYDACNLKDADQLLMQTLAREADALLVTHDLREVPLTTCLIRNGERPEELRVPPRDIWAMYDRYVRPLNWSRDFSNLEEAVMP